MSKSALIKCMNNQDANLPKIEQILKSYTKTNFVLK